MTNYIHRADLYFQNMQESHKDDKSFDIKKVFDSRLKDKGFSVDIKKTLVGKKYKFNISEKYAKQMCVRRNMSTIEQALSIYNHNARKLNKINDKLVKQALMCENTLSNINKVYDNKNDTESFDANVYRFNDILNHKVSFVENYNMVMASAEIYNVDVKPLNEDELSFVKELSQKVEKYNNIKTNQQSM